MNRRDVVAIGIAVVLAAVVCVLWSARAKAQDFGPNGPEIDMCVTPDMWRDNIINGNPYFEVSNLKEVPNFVLQQAVSLYNELPKTTDGRPEMFEITTEVGWLLLGKVRGTEEPSDQSIMGFFTDGCYDGSIVLYNTTLAGYYSAQGS